MDLFPNSYIMFLQNASTSEDQVGCKEEHPEPHRKQLNGSGIQQEYNILFVFLTSWGGGEQNKENDKPF